MNTSFDIIIAGAGISGLLLASQLSKDFSVLVIEKNEESISSKYWLTTTDCINGNEELSDCIDSHYDHMSFISHDLKSYNLNGNYTLWDSEKLNYKLKEQIKSNNSTVLYSCRFYSYYHGNSSVNVLASEYNFSCKLFIDCMGYSSPLVLAKNTMKIIGYHLLYGAILKLKKTISPVCIANVCISNSPAYLEIFPMSDGRAYVSLIMPVSKINDIQTLKNEFNFIIKNSIYSSYFESTEILKELGGIVPVGILNSRAFNRVFFFGEAAQMNPSSTGTCLTLLLKKYKEVTCFLKECIEKNKLTKRTLESKFVLPNRFSRNFQIFLFKDMLTWNSDKFAEFLKLLNHIDNSSINKFLFSEIHISDFLDRRNLISVLKSKNKMWVKPFIKALIA